VFIAHDGSQAFCSHTLCLVDNDDAVMCYICRQRGAAGGSSSSSGVSSAVTDCQETLADSIQAHVQALAEYASGTFQS
jgi:hypothetical protein